ncbi:MAG: class A beta-lactamase [Archangium sp.]
MAIATRPVSADPQKALTQLENSVKGRIGVFAMRGEKTFEYRATSRFAYCSSFKWILAAAVLDASQRGEVALTQKVKFTKKDLLNNSPIVDEHIKAGVMTVGELCEATVTVSDNAAANLLAPLVGGLEGLSAFVKKLGDSTTRFDRMEPFLNTNEPGDKRDTTTPEAMTRLLNSALTSTHLSEASKVQLFTWMKAATTGLGRIRKSVPKDWSCGDKTGTSGNGALIDVAVLRPPSGEPIYLSVFLNARGIEMDKGSEIIAKAARIVIPTV